MLHYYYTDGKKRFGPFTIDELKDKQITPETLVWKEGLPDWVPATTLSDLQILFPVEEHEVNVGGTVLKGQQLVLPPKNWLVESVLVTIFCCLPLGIVGIILSLLVDTMWREGHRDAAVRISKEAGRWVRYGFIFGIIAILLYMILISSGMLAGLGTGMEV